MEASNRNEAADDTCRRKEKKAKRGEGGDTALRQPRRGHKGQRGHGRGEGRRDCDGDRDTASSPMEQDSTQAGGGKSEKSQGECSKRGQRRAPAASCDQTEGRALLIRANNTQHQPASSPPPPTAAAAAPGLPGGCWPGTSKTRRRSWPVGPAGWICMKGWPVAADSDGSAVRAAPAQRLGSHAA